MTTRAIAGHRNDAEVRLARQLRDAYSSAPLVCNARILAPSARMLLFEGS